MTTISTRDICRRSLDRPEEFWGEAASGIDWTTPWEKVLDETAQPAARWFVGEELKRCHNALDRHVGSGRADQTALIFLRKGEG